MSFNNMITMMLSLLVLPVVMIAGFQSGLRTRQCYRSSSVVRTFPFSIAASTANDGESPVSSNKANQIFHPWRVVMDIGREPLARMPFNWARQGVRMPLVVPTDIGLNTAAEQQQQRFIAPRSETVGFTSPQGYQESKIVGNGWELSEDGAFFSASYTIVDELRKRDVVIEAGTELYLRSRVYTQTEIDRLNEEFFKAREAMVWNENTERWELPQQQSNSDDGGNNNPFAMVKNQFLYWIQNAKQEQARNERPDPETLSDLGGKIPGIGNDNDEYVYLVQDGVVRYGGENGPVCGLWKAQPISGMGTR